MLQYCCSARAQLSILTPAVSAHMLKYEQFVMFPLHINSSHLYKDNVMSSEKNTFQRQEAVILQWSMLFFFGK